MLCDQGDIRTPVNKRVACYEKDLVVEIPRLQGLENSVLLTTMFVHLKMI